jgi:hypothetical protein
MVYLVRQFQTQRLYDVCKSAVTMAGAGVSGFVTCSSLLIVSINSPHTLGENGLACTSVSNATFI